MSEAITNGPRDMRTAKFEVPNYSQDLTISCTESSAANIAAVLGSLIAELKKIGIVEATVAT